MTTEPTTPAPAAIPNPSLTTTQATLPTLGAVVGSALGAFINSKLGALDPLLGSTVVTVTTALVTALFHWAGTRLGALKL